jgi:hypothetical protein
MFCVVFMEVLDGKIVHGEEEKQWVFVVSP